MNFAPVGRQGSPTDPSIPDQLVAAALRRCGERHRRTEHSRAGAAPTGQQVLPVLGGTHIGSLGSPVDVMLWLDVAEVREAHEFLEGIDFRELIENRRHDLGRALDGLTGIVAEHLEGLRRFYRLAAQADEAVVKRLYAP